VLSLHCPLTPQTRSWLNASRIAQLKRGSIVINTARGDVVDEAALASALQSGHLYGAGVDVFCGEPVVSDVLRAAPNLVILPHLGSATVETRTAMGAKVLENVSALLAGQMPLPTQVNL
jgi:glyoxylate reductase